MVTITAAKTNGGVKDGCDDRVAAVQYLNSTVFNWKL